MRRGWTVEKDTAFCIVQHKHIVCGMQRHSNDFAAGERRLRNDAAVFDIKNNQLIFCGYGVQQLAVRRRRCTQKCLGLLRLGLRRRGRTKSFEKDAFSVE